MSIQPGFEDLLKKTVTAEVDTTAKTLEKFSHDASIFEIFPKAVVFPKKAEEVEKLVQFVNSQKKSGSALSLTARSAGTDMSGGPLNDSIIVDFTKYINKFESLNSAIATTQPGIYYRDFEKETLKKNLIFPAYPASREICTIGGMVNNNAGGEKTLNYGKIEDYIKSIKVVLADGREHEFSALSQKQLEAKMSAHNFEGEIYKKIYNLILENYEIIKKAKPNVSKNSAGYFLWNVYDKKTKIFDLTKLFVGAQGTLGLVTQVQIKLVPATKHSEMVIIYMDSLENLVKLINIVLPLKPESFETYDDHTFKLAVRYFATFTKHITIRNVFSLGWSLMPDILKVITGKVPKLVLQVEFAGNDKNELTEKSQILLEKLKPYNLEVKVARSKKAQKKYWLFRRESFNLLRHKIKTRHTAPFIDDFEVRPEYLEEFLPRLYKIFNKYPDLIYTIAGHVGDGNFHIIPLMDMGDEKQRETIPTLSKEVYDLVLNYKGTITAEHNDGLIRTPFLRQMYGEKIYDLFQETKNIFDPDNIFNPRKKVGENLKYVMEHIRLNW